MITLGSLALGALAIRCGSSSESEAPDASGACEPYLGRLPCDEQGLVAALELGGGPFLFACDGPRRFVLDRELVIDTDVVLDGEGNVTLDGGGAHRVLRVEREAHVEIRGFTITGGDARTEPYSLGLGGGILNDEGTLMLVNTTVHGNVADYGGGIANSLRSTMTLLNCTIANNEAERMGGGIHHAGADLVIRHGTLSDNTAAEGSAISALVPAAIAATLVDGTCNGRPAVSEGYNVESPGSTCGFDTPTDRADVGVHDLGLDPLQDDAVGVPTCGLSEGSVAVDRIPEAECVDHRGVPLTTDQRGLARPVGPACDIGAIEWGHAPPSEI